MAFAAAASMFLLLGLALPAIETETTFRVRALPAEADAVGLYVNRVDEPPQVLPVVPEQVDYSFTAPVEDITFLRVDFYRADGSTVSLAGVDVLRGDRVLARYGPAELSRWAMHDLAAVPGAGPASSLRLVGAGPDPFLQTTASLHVDTLLPEPLHDAVKAISPPLRRFYGCVLLAGLLGAAHASRAGGRLLLLAAATSVVALSAFFLVRGLPAPVTEPAHAVGRATYLGLPLAANQRAVTAAFLAALAVPLLVLWRIRGRAHPIGEEPDGGAGARGSSVPRALEWAVAAAAAVVAFAVLLPDLPSGVAGAATGLLSPQIGNFDAGNSVAWTAFSAEGMVPMRDFWFPYGNMTAFESDAVWGPLTALAVRLIVLGGFAWVFWHLSGRRVMFTSLGALAVLLAQPFLSELSRYGLALVVGLSYTVLARSDDGSRLAARLVFSLLVLTALLVEPVLVVYAGCGVALLLGVDVVRLRSHGWRWWLRRLCGDAAGPLLALVVAVLVMAGRGQLGNIAVFYTTLGESAAYSALPTAFSGVARFAAGLEGGVVWIPAVLAAVGLWARAGSDLGERGKEAGAFLLVLGGAAFPLLQKHAIRPLAPYQLVALVMLAALLPLLMRRGSGIPRALGVGTFAAALTAMPLLGGVPSALTALPERLSDDVVLVAQKIRDPEIGQRRYGPERFTLFADETAVVNHIADRLEPGGRDLYVLGDVSVLYAMLDQDPPWQSTIYNASPLRDQARVLRWLLDAQPDVVVLSRRSNQAFDEVPNTVRVPLLYRYVAENYGLEARFGDLDVLTRTSTNRQQYWPEALSPVLDLGHIPAHATEPEPCSGESRCVPYLQLRAEVEDEQRIDLPVLYGEVTITIGLTLKPDRSSYVVPLAHTWPYGLSQDVALLAEPLADVTAKLVLGEELDERLY